MTERQLQDGIVELARILGWLAYHTHDSRRSQPGFPDLVLVRGERLIFAELKSENGRVSPAQKVWLGALEHVAGEVERSTDDRRSRPGRVEVYLWRPADWPDTVTQVLR